MTNVCGGTAVLCVVQARTGSTRLPGKVLREVGGVPMLEFLLRRLERFTDPHFLANAARVWSSLGVVVATTDEAVDDPIAEIAERCGVEVVRGDEYDVLGRFAKVVNGHLADHVVRITADCPLTDPVLVAAVVTKHLERGAHYTTNVLPRTFPKGLDVEVIDSGALLEANRLALDAVEREHVTPFLYRRPERYTLANLRSGRALGDLRWTVDTAEDLDAVREIVRRVGECRLDWERASWQEMYAAVGEPTVEPAIGEIALRPATLADASHVLEWRNEPEAVRFSTTRTTIERDTHDRWFTSVLDDPGCRALMAELNGETIAALRVDVTDGTGVVSISVAPPWRGRGYGKAVLRALSESIANDCQVRELEAVVHPDNVRSLHAFEATGFSPVADERSDGMRVLRRAS